MALPPLAYAIVAAIYIVLFRDYPLGIALERLATGAFWVATGVSPFVAIGAMLGFAAAKVEVVFRHRN